MSESKTIEFVTSVGDGEVDLYAGDFTNAPAFGEELRLFLDGLEDEETLIISLLPPFEGRFAAGGAVDVIREVLTDVDKAPGIRLLVKSRSTADALRPRLDVAEREPVTFRVGELVVELVLGDITTVEADGIVNASNTRLELGAGVSGAIRRKAQSGLQDALFAIARGTSFLPGDVVVTDSYGLPATTKILHTATASGDRDVIRRALINCLHCAEDEGLESLAIPALGTGTGGLSVTDFGELMLESVRDFVGEIPNCGLRRIMIVVWTPVDFDALRSLWELRS